MLHGDNNCTSLIVFWLSGGIDVREDLRSPENEEPNSEFAAILFVSEQPFHIFSRGKQILQRTSESSSP